MARLGVVIPAYNAVASLEKTVRSVLEQTFADIELWLVDDGSTDGTGALIDRLAREDGRVRVIHQDNMGCYGARLTALKRLATPYFTFADADDTLMPTMYERMMDLADREQLDVVQCAHLERGAICNLWKGPMILPDQDSVRREYVQDKILDVREACFVWNKVYRNQYDFSTFDPTDHVTNFEDLIFNIQFFLPVRRMGFVNEPLYTYEIVPGSAVHSYSADKIKDFREAGRIRRLFVPRYGMAVDDPTMLAWTLRNARNAVVTAATAQCIALKKQGEFVAELVGLPDVRQALMSPGKLTRDLLVLQLAQRFPRGLCLLIKILRRLA